MLMIVIEKPMQFTMVSAVPFVSAGAFWATSVEKSGSIVNLVKRYNKTKI
ncbi:MAG: hypothetical protein ACJAWV_001286 [Flammeovirgaceae bacterium]|jgi:hypothetical protein